MVRVRVGYHMAVSVNPLEGEASLLFCVCLLVRRSPSVAQADFKLLLVVNLRSSCFVLMGGEITVWHFDS